MLPGCSSQKWQVKLSLFPPPQAPLQKELPGMTGSVCCRNSQSYLREVAVINAMLKRRQAAVLCRNLSQLQRGGSEFGCLHRCVSAVCPVPGASPALAGTAAPCSDGHRCLLPPRSTSPWGKQSVSLPELLRLLISPATGHFITVALLCLFDIKIHELPLPMPYRNGGRILNEYQLSYRISTAFLQRR